MNILTLIAIVVLSAMPTGYRRAGFSLEQGENLLDVNQEQFDLLSADKNLTVSVVDADSAQADIGTHVNANVDQLRDDNANLQKQVAALTKMCEGQEEAITSLEQQLDAAQGITHEDTLDDLAGTVVVIQDKDGKSTELDVSSAPEELHHWIAVIDDLNNETPLTKKPNCDHLTITVDDEPLTPTAAQRDAAWAWYQENIKIVEADDATSSSNTEAEA